MKPRLFTALMTGLLWVGTTLPCTARELTAQGPARASMLDVARNARVAGLPADSGITLTRVWVEGAHGQVCAVARRADGELLIHDGELQLKRVELRRRGSTWDVERAERLVMPADMALDAACQQSSPETVMANAIKTLEAHPSAAGIKGSAPQTEAVCPEPALASEQAKVIGPGVVAPAGRSLLHTAPDLRCRMGKHIVQGDKVAVLAQVSGWSQVRYTHPITHVVTVGWLKSGRIKPPVSTDL